MLAYMYTKFLLCSAITIVVPCLVNDNRTQSPHICEVKVKMTGWHVSSMMNMMTKYEKHIMITNKRHTTNLTNFNKVNGPWIQGQDREQEICTLHDEYWEEWCMVTLTFDTGDIYTGKVTGETWKWFFNKTNLSSHNTCKTRTNLNYNSNLTLIKILKILSVQWILLYLKPLTFTSLNMCVRRFNLIISSTKIYQNEIDALN